MPNMVAIPTAETSKSKRWFSKVEPFLYLLPICLVFGVFLYYPLIRTLHMSVSIVNSMGVIVSNAGLENFAELFKDKMFWSSVGTTFRFVLMVVPAQIIIGVLLALLAVNIGKKFNFLSVIYALPMAISSACASVIWLMLFNPATGLINWLLHGQYNWLGNEHLAPVMIAATTVWLSLGMNFIYSFSGLQGIPQELYECSAIEGTTYLQNLRFITLPCMSPTLFFLLVTNTIGAFQTFAQVNLMTQGGPGKSTYVLAYSIYREAFLNNRWGYACAQSLVFMTILLVISLLQFKLEKGVHYQ